MSCCTRAGCLLAFFLVLCGSVAAGAASDIDAKARSLFEWPSASHPAGPIDELVFARLEKLGVEPAHLCSDAVFVRRVYLDVIGTLPSAAEAQQFLQDRTPEKRRPTHTPAPWRVQAAVSPSTSLAAIEATGSASVAP